METKRFFCITCDDYVEPETSSIIEHHVIHGFGFDINTQRFTCPVCGDVVGDGSLDEHIDEIQRAYCEKSGCITREELVGLLAKYDIGCKPLASLLRWGELTIYRYTKGALPKVDYGRQLKSLLDPMNMDKLLEQNIDAISSGVYRKTKVAIESAYKQKAKQNKANDISCYFIASAFDEIMPTKLWCQKLLYFAQAWHLHFFHAPMFLEPIESWDRGPVVREVWNTWSSSSDWEKERPIPTARYSKSCSGFQIDVSEEQKKLIDSVVKIYGRFQANELVNLSHKDNVWISCHKVSNSTTMPLWRIKEEYDLLSARLEISSIDDMEKLISQLC